jgi:Rps23 Pro-64 3,4-dihydroxylase Tpa1-like proline 4-hydroxylase
MNKEILATGIYSYSNVFLDCLDHINKIENLSQSRIISWIPSFPKNTTEENKKKAFRNVDTIGIPVHTQIPESFDISKDPAKTLYEFSEKLSENFNPNVNDYLTDFGITVSDQEPYGLLKYGNGQKFDKHIDDGMKFIRKVSLVYYANDEYSGGEIYFDQFNLKFKPQKNQLLIFPSNYIYTHSISEVTEGHRYSIVSWFK